ncbi:hypothetical protein VNO78_15099 [Psophocarpus tetragonolobus]|uniref:Uncharacterized protein n=1 Tax=Psophocarpus tetragonolobus TaxID=3891 RepID=A0AAN9SI17_PSOTE
MGSKFFIRAGIFWRQALIALTILSYILKCKYEEFWDSTYFDGKREFSYCTGKFLGLLYQGIAIFNISISLYALYFLVPI